jgi:hypothetical protein
MLSKTDRQTAPRRLLINLALAVAIAPGLAACGSSEEDETEDAYGIVGPFENGAPLGKADSAGVPGPLVMTDTRATQVWSARNKWEDTDTSAASAAGIAWSEDSGLNWDEKYGRWIDAMERAAGNNTYYETYTFTTPWGKTLPAPKLECAEMAIFMRATFAAWYELPFYMTAVDGDGTRVYFGHFGARTKTSRYKNTPKYGHWYQDHSDMSAEQALANWPKDEKLRAKGLYGGGDDMDWLFPGAKAGAYFDEIHLNKRVGHFTTLLLAYFGSMHLAGSRNTFNLKPESLREGDVLVKRWQKRGIGHTLIVKEVENLPDGQLEANLVSGSMPRRQPKWEDGVASKNYFTNPHTGGEGSNGDGDEYAKLGGGIKRFRVTKNIGGYWTNTWMGDDESSWINSTDYEKISERPARFETLLGEVSPEQKRDALLAMIEDQRNHLRLYPASCAARERREASFKELYELLADEFGMDRTAADANYRTFEDYVFAELEYEESKTCCWNSSNNAMYQIAMDYNQSLQENACTEPVVFRATDGGYEVFKQYADATGRGHLWKPWSEDEHCEQRDAVNDVIKPSDSPGYCELGEPSQPSDGSCADDAYEANDSASSATPLQSTLEDAMVCSGNDDFFGFSVPTGGSATVRIDFSHAEGDLDMELQQGGQVLDSSTSTDDFESITVGGGSYSLRVYGYSDAEARYSVSVTLH